MLRLGSRFVALLLVLLAALSLRALGGLDDEGLEASGFYCISLVDELIDLRKEFIVLDLGKHEAFAGFLDDQRGERLIIEAIGILNVALCLLDLHEQLVHAGLGDRDLAVDRSQLAVEPHAGLISQDVSCGRLALLTATTAAATISLERVWTTHVHARAVAHARHLRAGLIVELLCHRFGTRTSATRVFGLEPSDCLTQHHATEHDAELFELGMALGADTTVVPAMQ